MKKKKSLQILFIIFMINIALFAIANTERRVALVWGNSSYLGWDNLPVCTNDADTIADKLSGLGFDTILLKNGTRDEMMTSLEEFEKRIEMEKTDVAVFFYSGHAFNQGDYYLVPSNTELNSERIKRRDYLPASFILEVMENSRLSLLFFDACRVGGGIGGLTKGATMVPQVGQAKNNNSSPKGMTIFYATQDDQKATTGNDGVMSPFSRALADHLFDPDEFRSVWQKIKSDVSDRTEQLQRPNCEEPYENSFYFNPSDSVKPDMSQADVVNISYEELLNKYLETEEKLRQAKKELLTANTIKTGEQASSGIQNIYSESIGVTIEKNKSKNKTGISVSKHQGIINWKAVHENNQDIEFVYIKATDGADFADPRYQDNIRAARNSGVKVGSYHFLSTKSPIEAQFQNFINTVNVEDQDIIPVIDCESRGNWTSEQLRDSLEFFAKKVEQHFGCKPMIYTSEKYFTTNLGSRFKDYPLWIAKYLETEPQMDYEWTLWNFTDQCPIPGIEGNRGFVEASVFNKQKTLKDILLLKNL